MENQQLAIENQAPLHRVLVRAYENLVELNKSVGWRDGEWYFVSDIKKALDAYGAQPAPGPYSQHRAYGVFRQRHDENHGREFFYHAMWHNDTIPDEGERVVPGWFLSDAALNALLGEARPVGYFLADGATFVKVQDEYKDDVDVFPLFRKTPPSDAVEKLTAARDKDLARYDDTPTAFAMRAIAEDAWNKAIAALNGNDVAGQPK